jgi:hypothetical protein
MEKLKSRQGAQQNWLQYGDKNSKYFHACVNQRRKTNIMKQVRIVEGLLCTRQGDIEVAFLNYYKHLFRSSRLEVIEGCLSGMA